MLNTTLTSAIALCVIGLSSVSRAADNVPPAPEVGSLAKRKQILEKLQQRLLPVTKGDAFNDFLKREGELPPDFDLMPSQFFLPDPLTWVEQGQARRATLAAGTRLRQPQLATRIPLSLQRQVPARVAASLYLLRVPL
jgi:hypothetical protein